MDVWGYGRVDEGFVGRGNRDGEKKSDPSSMLALGSFLHTRPYVHTFKHPYNHTWLFKPMV